MVIKRQPATNNKSVIVNSLATLAPTCPLTCHSNQSQHGTPTAALQSQILNYSLQLNSQ